MVIDLKAISEEIEVSQVLEKDWWQPGQEDDPLLGLDTPLQVRIKISRVRDKFVLNGQVSGGVLVRCDRCLDSFRRDLESAFNVFLVFPKSGMEEAEVELLDEDMGVEFIHGETIDVNEIIKEQIFLSLPMKSICKEGCLGLCPACGLNLNEGGCQCNYQGISPAFSKLTNLKIQGD